MVSAKVAVPVVVALVVFASLALVLTHSSSPDVKVGVAWREGSPETLVDACKSIEEAGGTYVMLGQVFCDGLEYDDRGKLVSGLEENGMLGLEAAQTVRAGTWRASNAADVVGSLKAIVFTGGEDISPNLYAEPQAWVDTGEDVPSNPERDVSDFLTMSYCLDMDIPVLAICRGMQMLSVVSGATMMQDVAMYFEEQGVPYGYEHRNPMPPSGYRDFAKHSVEVSEGTILHSIYGKALLERCPSWHHQAVASVEGTPLTLTAMSYDGGVAIIEGVERADKTFAVGVQYHPETAVSRGSDGQDCGYMDYDDAIAVFKTIVRLASRPCDHFKSTHDIQRIMAKTTLKIEGMMCEGCVGNVKKALEALEGVSAAEVNLKKGTAVVTHEGVSDEAMISAVVDAGFRASVKKGLFS